MDKITGFEWDEGNREKNWIRHQVTNIECEEVFFNVPLLIENDEKHAKAEERYYLLGRTHQNRILFVAFTIRNEKIRVISARDMNRKERKIDEKALTEV